MTAIEMTSYPFNNEETREAQWTLLMRTFDVSGVIAGVDDELEVYADSSGMQVKVKEGALMVLGHRGNTDGEETLAIDTADATYDRYDRIVARLDWADDVIELDVVKGVASASPTVPTLTQNSSIHEIPLATVLVDAAAVTIASTKVTDERLRVGKKTWQGQMLIGNGKAEITTGVAGWLLMPPLPLSIKSVKLLGDQTGSISISLWADLFANGLPTVGDKITASDPIAISSDVSEKKVSFTGWTTSFINNNNDQYVLTVNVDSVSTFEQVLLEILADTYELVA